jgi:ABC-2 type transport system permease protein
MKAIKMLVQIVTRTLLIAIVLTFFFSMMAGMYYNSEPRDIRTAIVDEDQSPLSRAIIYNIKSSNVFNVEYTPVDYLALQNLMDEGKIDAGVVIPHNLYKDALNGTSDRILAVLNGTANPIIPKLAVGNLNMIIMTVANQMQFHVPVEDLGAIPNYRHQMLPLLSVSSRVFYSPTVNMESSMLPAFMGLAMQVVSLVIIVLLLNVNLKQIHAKMPGIRLARQLPMKAVVIPAIISWLIVTTAIALAFYSVMVMFAVPLPVNFWNVVFVISVLVMAMESMSLFFSLNIRNTVVLVAIYTLIVLPAFMYSGFLVPFEQMPAFPRMAGGWFPLRYYLEALYGVFNRGLNLVDVGSYLNSLYYFTGAFLTLSLISVLVGTFERKRMTSGANSSKHIDTLPKEVLS